MTEVAKYTGKNYNLAVIKTDNGCYVDREYGRKSFKDEFRAVEWCEGYIEGVERYSKAYDFQIVMPRNLLFLINRVKKEAKTINLTEDQIVVKAINKYFKNKKNANKKLSNLH